MPKGVIKTEKVSISINKEIHRKLTHYCDDTLINKSKLINKIIEKFLEEENITNKLKAQ